MVLQNLECYFLMELFVVVIQLHVVIKLNVTCKARKLFPFNTFLLMKCQHVWAIC